MELNMTVKQTTTLSPQMMQSMEILQMGTQELLEHIQELVQENPVLEVTEQYDKADEFAVLKRKLEWLESTDVQNRYYQRDDSTEENDPISNYGNTEQWEENLPLFLLSQLPTQKLSPEMETGVRFLIESLNSCGYFDEDLSALVSQMGMTQEQAEKALNVVQSLDPAGVGARSLSECLCIQLERQGEKNSLAYRIAKDHLDALSKSRYGYIAKQLNVDPAEVRAACDVIRTLNPKPGAGFACKETPVYITPDVIVVSFSDHFELLINDYYFPSLSISGYYRSLMKDCGESDVRDYLMGKVRQAKWVMKSIEQRRSTLMDCAKCILDLQEAFFRHGPGHLVPMTLSDVSTRLGIHESTVSRAVKDKYLQCSMGIFPFSYFFSRSLGTSSGTDGGDDSASPDAAKAMLRKLIAEENKKKPLSDQKICELMEEKGIVLSRRTVAKYRDALGIPSTTGRKEYE